MNPVRAWNRFWFAPISARPLGAYRIIFGVLVLAHLAFTWMDIDYWYTDAGLLRGNEARIVAGDLRYSPLQYVQDPIAVRLIVAGIAVVAALFTAGWRTRVMGVLLYLGQLSLYHRNMSSVCGPDTVRMLTSFYLMLSPCGAAYSLDARRAARRRGTAAEPLIVPWAQRLLQVQLALIYFATAAFKCHGATWLSGTAVHFVLFNAELRQLDMEWLASYPVLLCLFTYGALFVEFGLAFLLWFRPTRTWFALLGVGLHAGILPMVNVPLFGEQMVAVYLVFLAPDELASLLQVLDPRAWLRRRRQEWDALSARLDPAGALPGWRQLELSFESAETTAA
ncbi:Vitamin K-dependent gamma-carboxylase [Aquisphaera giovannonii]|uniref:Vitamin K-dependent gamma-carboxylase n=1 Tax=Aquisphaera giovannonii TaxID=406548 RepID=A0A5B9VZZ0_9BACT|nr:HTTM domain-containing protein [Aquisphaera giovannonii]QEH33557.1 Vitamin K-dependent gamma-carboxylase [Aquisphaera giovannonii]